MRELQLQQGNAIRRRTKSLVQRCAWKHSVTYIRKIVQQPAGQWTMRQMGTRVSKSDIVCTAPTFNEQLKYAERYIYMTGARIV